MLAALMLSTCLAGPTEATPMPTAPYYETRRLHVNIGYGYHDKLAVRNAVRKQMRGRITAIRRHTSAGPVAIGLRRLSAPELRAAMVALAFGTVGAELDVVMPDAEGWPVPVTVWWEAGDVLVFQRGPTLQPVEHPVLTREGVQAKYGVERFIDSERHWDSRSLGLVDAALATLTEPELDAIRDVPFRRVAEPTPTIRDNLPPGTRGTPTGVYVHDDWGPRIEVYDPAIERDGWFIGRPDDPVPAPVMVMLHELGHAVARQERRKLSAQEARIWEEYQARSKVLDREIAAFDRYVAAYNADRKRGDRAWIDREQRRIDRAIAANNRLVDSLHAVRARFDEEETQAARDLSEILGSDGAPTLYGMTNPEEAFAECFALFHADPDALLRARPAAHAWFVQGGHLAADGVGD